MSRSSPQKSHICRKIHGALKFVPEESPRAADTSSSFDSTRSLLLLFLFSSAEAQYLSQPTTVTGVATVTDGDTIQVQGVRVRLFGIDAPESSQVCERSGQRYGCGHQAAFALSDLIGGRPVTCKRRAMDRYGRVVGLCWVRSVELNRWMVRQGQALAYLRYVGRVYSDTEQAARTARLTCWHVPESVGLSPEYPPAYSWDTPGTIRHSTVGGQEWHTCREAKGAGAAPLHVGQPGYRPQLDRDHDGVACK